MLQAFLSYIITGEFLQFFFLLLFFSLLRYFLHEDIAKKEHNAQKKRVKKELFFYVFIFFLLVTHTISGLMSLDFLSQITTFSVAILVLSTITLIVQRQVLILYGEEVEVSGQSYFKKGYKVSLFSLFVNALSFLIGVFLCIEIFHLDSFIEIGGLWAGILAFMGFTAPVWALDMIAGIILLQSKNYETGNIFYLYDLDKYVWIKSISLTEVKCIDLTTSNPILFRPSKFRDLSVKNISLGIVGKSNKILREMEIQVDFHISKQDLESLCYEAFDTLQVDLLRPDSTNYFGEEPYRELLIDSFGDYAVKYKFFYTVTSPFYIFKAQRILNEYLLRYQQEKNLYFSTPDLVEISQKNRK